MKVIVKVLSLCTCIVMSTFGNASSISPNIIFSESFESPVVNVTNYPLFNGDWVNFGTGTPGFMAGSNAPVGGSFTGDSGIEWSIPIGNVDLVVDDHLTAAEGVQSLNLNGFEQGAIEASINFPAIGNYTLIFALSKNPTGVDVAKLSVTLDSVELLDSPYSYDSSNSAGDMAYRYISVNFSVASAGLHSLRFTSLNEGSGFGPMIDSMIIASPASYSLLDSDSDLIINFFDTFPLDSTESVDADSDGIGNNADTDDDGDGVVDGDDAFPLDATESVDTDSDGTGNNADTDDDGDGVADSDDAFPLDSAESSDSDGDGLGDNADAFPNDSSETVDSDSDGVGDNADVFPNDPTESADTDLDGVGDNADAFPNDASEALDSDSDGVGDNSDAFPNKALYSVDSDADGMPDAWETRYGLDPNDPSDATSDQDNDGITALDEFLAGTIPSGSLDIDGNDQYDALTDGLLLLRGMFGLDGSALVTGTIASDAAYTDSVDIESRIATLGELADIDGNGDIDALTDGLLTLRYLFGLQGDTLINGVVAGDATRKTAEEIEAHLETLMPAL